MNSTLSQIQCSNPACLSSANPLGQRRCSQCQTPLIYRYLGAVGQGTEAIVPGSRVGERYVVISPQIWLDTLPAQAPELTDPLPAIAQTYQQLYGSWLHLPVVYGLCTVEPDQSPVLLLENIPTDTAGRLLPSLSASLPQATAVRQVYWLWQLLELWALLHNAGAAAALLVPDNLRVEGWRVRLRHLSAGEDRPEAANASLNELSTLWQSWIKFFQPEVAAPLYQLFLEMHAAVDTPENVRAIAHSLNQILLTQAAQLPLQLSVAGATSTGPQRAHNEDTCYPTDLDLNDPLLPHVAMVCDGIGGHAGGEVASQMAVRSLQLQLRALLAEVAEEIDLIPPEIVGQQLAAAVRVVNNLIAAQNDLQKRQARQRMGTTLTLALQLPQKIKPLEEGTGIDALRERNAHELYVLNLGDSRAYWLTANHCYLLTVDDDVVKREVRAGRSTYRTAMKRPDAGAIIQALGTRPGDMLHPTIQRFILEEEGILMLCSDGLTDHRRVEQFWAEPTRQVLTGKMSLEQAAEYWIHLADKKNGHDNASVVLMHCQLVAPIPPEPVVAPAMSGGVTAGIAAPEPVASEADNNLLYGDAAVATVSPPETASAPVKMKKPLSWGALMLIVVILTFGLGLGSMLAWRQLDPNGFQRFWQRSPQPSQPTQ
jgi:protein phosphatase